MNFDYEKEFEVNLIVGGGVHTPGVRRADVSTTKHIKQMIDAFELLSGLNTEQYRIHLRGVWSDPIWWNVPGRGWRKDKDIEINTTRSRGFYLVGITASYLVGVFDDEPQNTYKVTVGSDYQSVYLTMGLNSLLFTRIDFETHINQSRYELRRGK